MTPRYASVADFADLSGLSRATIYRLLAARDLRAVKAGKRTLLDVEHGLAYLAALPPAEIQPPYRPKVAA